MTFDIGKEFVDDFIAHYADPNYDPAKAHEYYLMTRELQGRKPRGPAAPKAPKGPKGPSAQTLANRASAAKKHELGIQKKNELNSASVAQTARLDTMRVNADATKKRIQDALNAKLAELEAKTKLNATPPKLIPIPDNATPQVRQFLEKQNAFNMDKFKRDQKLAQTQADREKNTASQQAKQAATDEIRKIGTDLQAAIANARIEYDKAKTQLVAKYQQAIASA